MTSSSALSESEKQWLQNFERKIAEIGGRNSFTTPFLDPRQLELAEAVLRNNRELSYAVFGGHPSAERNMLNIFPLQLKGGLPPVQAVLVEWNSRNELGHRDLLGAVMALGLKREQIGDIILFEDNKAALFVDEGKTNYILSNLSQAGNVALNCKLIDPHDLPLAADEGREIKGTVASLRIDAILSLGFGISRSRVVLLIKGGLVRVNWRPISSPSHQVKEGDQISLKGRGRILVQSVEGETRKGRIRLKLKKYA